MLRVIEFKTEYRPGRDPVDWVLVGPAGADFLKTQTWHRIKDIRPPESPDRNMKESASYQDIIAKWSVIGPQYEAWREGEEIPETGTPLAAWAGVSPEQVKALHAMGIRTVEDVRDAGEAAVRDLRFPNAKQLPSLAKEFLEGADSSKKDAKIAELEERMAAMAEMLEAQLAEKPDAPKRGRPRKEVEAA